MFYKYFCKAAIHKVNSANCYPIYGAFLTHSLGYISAIDIVITTPNSDWTEYSLSFGPTGSGADYTIPTSACYIKMYAGYFTAGSGAGEMYVDNCSIVSSPELIDLYTGEISDVSYTKSTCKIKARDKLWEFAQKTVSDPTCIDYEDAHIQIPPSSQYLISDIAWTLCTCYGALDSTADSSNTDIDYVAFSKWAEQFSSAHIYAKTDYRPGTKVIKALTELTELSDSAIWIEGDGKLNFKKFFDVGSEGLAFTDDEITKLVINVKMDRLINRQWVYFDYAVESEYWQSGIVDTSSTSVNTFGLREGVLKKETVWYVDSVSARNLAARKIALKSWPSRKFTFISGMHGIYMQVGDTGRLVSDFYDLTSGAGFAIEQIAYDMDKLNNKYVLNEALVMNGFFLDVSTLDGTDLLL